MKTLRPMPTAVTEVAELLSSNPEKVRKLYEQLEDIDRSMDSDNQKSKKAGPLRRNLCACEFDRVESASLRLRKFVHLGANSKDDEMNEVCKRINRTDTRRVDWSLPSALVGEGHEMVMKLEGHLAIHLAGGILDNAGMCIHPHFNCPYLPGSGVKGVARHAAWAKWSETKSVEDALKVAWTFGFPTGDKRGLDAFLAENKPEWFGKEGKLKSLAGLVAFLPALPVEGGFRAVADVLTCHHPEYYQGGGKRASDDESPNPQFFPVIESGSQFRFIIRPLHSGGDDLPTESEVMRWARDFLIEGMTLYGAGAKTAAGYGWFAYDPEEEMRRKVQESALQKRQNIAVAVDALLLELESTEAPTQEMYGARKLRYDELLELAETERMELPGKQRVEDALNRIRKKLPQVSPLDRLREKWAAQNPKALINNDIKRFDKQNPDAKKLMVELLREPAGIGQVIWSQLRDGQKGDIGNAVSAIRAYCKNELKMGKMP